MPFGRRHPASGEDHGAAAVEFALVVIPLLLIVFGIIEFGLIFAQNQALGNGARQGARLGVVANPSGSGSPTESCAAILSQVQSAASTIGIASGAISAQVDITDPTAGTSTPCPAASSGASTTVFPCQGTNSGTIMTVTATYNSKVLVPLVITGSTVKLTGKGVFQCEYQN